MTVLVPSKVISDGLSQRMTPDSSVTGRRVSYAGNRIGARPAGIRIYPSTSTMISTSPS